MLASLVMPNTKLTVLMSLVPLVVAPLLVLVRVGVADTTHSPSHHTSGTLRHGDTRIPLVPPNLAPGAGGIESSEEPQTVIPVEHPQYPIKVDGQHHNDLDHNTHYHGLFTGYPNYVGYGTSTGTTQRMISPEVHVHPKSKWWGGGLSVNGGLTGEPSIAGLLRVRGDWAEGEIELGQHRVGGSLYLMLSQRALTPYVVAGAGGVTRDTVDAIRGPYIEAGVGLSYSITSNLVLGVDARYFVGSKIERGVMSKGLDKGETIKYDAQSPSKVHARLSLSMFF